VEAGIVENVTKIPKVKQVGVQETIEYWENVGQGSASGALTAVDEAEKSRSAPSTPMQPVVESGGCLECFDFGEEREGVLYCSRVQKRKDFSCVSRF
jgi:hypothetical protein